MFHYGLDRGRVMGLLWFLVLSLLLVASSFAEYQEDKQKFDQSSLHLTLYHVRGRHSILRTRLHLPSLSEILEADQARVKSLNSRLVNKTAPPAIPVTSSSVNIPLKIGFSIGVGNYYAMIGFGTPTEYYPMVVDTGSSISWLQCQPCEAYCHPQAVQVFDPSNSMTFKYLSCNASQCGSLKAATLNDPKCTTSNRCVYTASYGDGSVSLGYLSQDSLSLNPSETLSDFYLGCGQYNKGLFGESAGFVGLARNELSMIAQLSGKYGYAFSYCLPTGEGSMGFLSIGSSSLAGSAYKFTAMLTDSLDKSLYSLRLSGIEVAGSLLAVGAAEYSGPTIIDSGTVITRLPSAVYAALKQEFVKIMSAKYKTAPAVSLLDTCFKGSLKELSADVPAVRLIFEGGADLNLAPQNVVIDVQEMGETCLAFARTDRVAIVGNHQQQTFNVAYDVQQSRIGFAVGGCN